DLAAAARRTRTARPAVAHRRPSAARGLLAARRAVGAVVHRRAPALAPDHADLAGVAVPRDDRGGHLARLRVGPRARRPRPAEGAGVPAVLRARPHRRAPTALRPARPAGGPGGGRGRARRVVRRRARPRAALGRAVVLLEAPLLLPRPRRRRLDRHGHPTGDDRRRTGPVCRGARLDPAAPGL